MGEKMSYCKIKRATNFPPSEAAGLPKDSKAQAEQVRSIAVERVGEVVGWLSSGLMKMVNEALILHLSL